MPQATSDTMTTAPAALNALAVPPMDWKRHHARQRDELEAEGIRITDAEAGAWWLTLAAIRRAEDCDTYGAEVTARRAGVTPPPTIGSAWARLRDGDRDVPGTRSLPNVVQPVARLVAPRRDPFLDAWIGEHDGAEVAVEDIAPRVRDLFVERVHQPKEWSGRPVIMSPFPASGRLPRDLAVKLATLIQTYFRGAGDEHGRLLEVRKDERGAPVSFQLRHPPLPAPPPPADPALAPVHAALLRKAAEIASDPAFFPGDTRAAHAVHSARLAWPLVVADFARERGVSDREADALLRARVFRDPEMQAKARAIADAAPAGEPRSATWARAVAAIVEAEAERTSDSPRAVLARMTVPGMTEVLEGRQ